MLGSRAGRKGHPAYSHIHVFRSLPALSQGILVATFIMALYGVMQLLPTDHAPITDPSLASTLSSFAKGAASGDTAAAAGSEEYRQQLAALTETSELLRAEVTTLREKLNRQQQVAAAALAEANKRAAEALRASSSSSSSKGSPSTALVSATSSGPSKAEGRGMPLGPFNWETVVIEPNSTQRRFWVKTATNEEGHHFYRRILVQNGWIETANPKHPHCYFQFYGRFVPGLTSKFSMFKAGKNMINHIPGEFAILNKEPFLHLMRNNSRDDGCDYTLMHPESYLIHLPEDCFDLFRVGDYPTSQFVSSRETQAQRDNTYWFWKPPFNSFGRGIKVSSLAALREKFGFGSALAGNPQANDIIRERCKHLASNLTDTKSRLLVQRAIDKPHLIKGTKYDFRAYILIANTEPYMVYHKFGHVRRCLRQFDITSKVKKAHVCNDYSDELENDDFPLNDHIWDYTKFKEFLVGEGYTPEEVDRGFEHNLKRLFLGVFKKFKDQVPKANGYWILLGLDVAITEDWEVRVLEINTNPSMHYGTKIWGNEIVGRNWRQMNEVLELVFDAHLKSKRAPLRSQDELVLKTKYGFHLLYSEYTNPPYQYDTSKCFVQKPQTRHP